RAARVSCRIESPPRRTKSSELEGGCDGSSPRRHCHSSLMSVRIFVLLQPLEVPLHSFFTACCFLFFETPLLSAVPLRNSMVTKLLVLSFPFADSGMRSIA